VIDRWVQQAVLQVLEPIFEPTFHEAATVFAVERSANRIAQARKHLESGHTTIVTLIWRSFRPGQSPAVAGAAGPTGEGQGSLQLIGGCSKPECAAGWNVRGDGGGHAARRAAFADAVEHCSGRTGLELNRRGCGSCGMPMTQHICWQSECRQAGDGSVQRFLESGCGCTSTRKRARSDDRKKSTSSGSGSAGTKRKRGPSISRIKRWSEWKPG